MDKIILGINCLLFVFILLTWRKISFMYAILLDFHKSLEWIESVLSQQGTVIPPRSASITQFSDLPWDK